MHKVLIVDDELAIRDMLRLALETAGYECLEAETIDTAYHQIIDDRPDIILLDWHATLVTTPFHKCSDCQIV